MGNEGLLRFGVVGMESGGENRGLVARDRDGCVGCRKAR